jgi:hypothetical protein
MVLVIVGDGWESLGESENSPLMPLALKARQTMRLEKVAPVLRRDPLRQRDECWRQRPTEPVLRTISRNLMAG